MADQQKHTFAAKLFQVAEVHTETFEIEAANEKEAKNRAEEILKTKDLDGVEHRLEFEDLTVKAEEEQAAMEAESAARVAGAEGPTEDQIQAVAEEQATSPAVAEELIRSGQVDAPEPTDQSSAAAAENDQPAADDTAPAPEPEER